MAAVLRSDELALMRAEPCEVGWIAAGRRAEPAGQDLVSGGSTASEAAAPGLSVHQGM